MIAMALACKPGAAHRRRAHHRPRRHHPGPDPGPACDELKARARVPRSCSSPTTWAWSPRWRDDVAVMYAGRIVEDADASEPVRRPAASLHRGAARLDPRPSAVPRRRAPGDHPGRRARSLLHPAGGLPLRDPLPGRRSTHCRRSWPRADDARWPRTHSVRCSDGHARDDAGRDTAAARSVRDVRQALPDPGRVCCGRSPRSRRWTASPSRSTRARPSAWWASPAAARPRSAARSCALDRADRGDGPSSTAATSFGFDASELQAAAPEDADDLPGPLLSLNPRMTVAPSSASRCVIHGMAEPRGARARGCASCCEEVGLRPRACCDRYPHEFSGGQRQRIGHRPGPGPEARARRLRRAGLRPRRLDPGPDHQPAAGPAAATSGSPTCSSPTT